MDDQIYCGICEVEIDEAINWKDYRYIHDKEEVWCDSCTGKQEAYYESMRD